MQTWTFSDGTIWQSGGVVIGETPFALWWREVFVDQRQYPDLISWVRVATPNVDVPLDLDNDYLLHLFAFQAANAADLTVSSQFQATDANMPAFLRELKNGN